VTKPEIKSLLKEITESNPIVVASVHHTGTWFMLNYLNGFAQVSGITEFHELVSGEKEFDSSQIIHFHIMGDTINSRGRVEEFPFSVVLHMVMNCRCVTPIRDPIYALISRQERHPELDHCFIVDGYSVMQFYDTIYVPIDLKYDNRHHRMWCLADSLMLLSCHPKYEENTQWIEKYTDEWYPANSRGWYDLKLRYRDHGDVEAVRKAIPKEFDYLLSKADEIIPLLMRVGYKDLPWWELI